jgi:hypothetical protein
MGFQWKDNFYVERSLPFGLATAPFIFNLFAEVFHWILQSWLGWKFLSHYLDDFICIFPMSASLDSIIRTAAEDYIAITGYPATRFERPTRNGSRSARLRSGYKYIHPASPSEEAD